MKYEIIDCIDAGTEYCPCHLAETGDCILCSELCNKTFCDCVNWKGTCIYQEFIWNGKKAKEGRKTYSCKLINKTLVEENLLILKIKVPYELSESLVHPGSLVFLRNPASEVFYNSPISIMNVNTEKSIISLAIEIKGTKTKKIQDINVGEEILVKGPFWNGVLGLRHILKCNNGRAIVVARGIGMAPMLSVIKKLCANGNKVTVIIDKGRYSNIFIKEYLDVYDVEIIECSTLLIDGELTEELKELLSNFLKNEDINLIHCSGADILNYKVMKHIGDNINYSCCNNAKMCCGEGMCGACTLSYEGDKIRRMCKLQVDPKYVFERRRLI
ncbi:hypothetical protein Z968_10700 [Clostridium novyi A str. 4552]|uniref:Flavoprotein pyridine nucleotide cytochrome reductase-like FAD-binding domain-containing protein n=1 Tax=Clostridium novyi A str. 4552 TaxID=1444289 RepID=A0A0A0I238_CLONO|nr:sulfide/dihydroorotate dehydrogenase-like FAD/NAD-binding protein [Clostridium novyi]KGM94852.1 hypothetical protein Z968_10700 [Clostridium novyi A str. 4552]